MALGRAGLPHHFFEGGGSHVEVARREGVAGGEVRVRILEVWEPDVHEPVQHVECVHRFIGPGVVDDRETEAELFGTLQRRDDGRHEVRRRDEVDVVGAQVFEFQEDVGELCGRQFGPGHAGRALHVGNTLQAGGDVVVLAEHTAQRAAGEEHRAGAALSGEAGLLPLVERRSGNAHRRRLLTATALAGRAVHAAGAGTETAGRELSSHRTSRGLLRPLLPPVLPCVPQ